jgi:hypothetical protein
LHFLRAVQVQGSLFKVLREQRELKTPQKEPSRRTAFATKSGALGAVAVKFLQRAQKLLQIEPYAVRLAEAKPAESVRLERKSTLLGFQG